MHRTLSGSLLVVLGSLWAAIGAVLLVLAWLYTDVASLPDWVAVSPNAPAPVILGLVGSGAVACGIGQLAAGLGVQRRAGIWSAWMGLVLALVGGAVLVLWLVSGLAQGRPVLVLLPGLVAYLYVAWVMAFGPIEARPD